MATTIKEEKQIVQTPPEVKPAVLSPEKNDQLISLLQGLSKSVASISERLTAVENRSIVAEPVSPVENVLSITKGPQENLPNPFAGVVPQALLDTAHKVLGKKFSFECHPCAEMPAFEFVVIVPPEYSELKGSQVDRRTKIIDNIQGANEIGR